jgi:intracellular septation protein A
VALDVKAAIYWGAMIKTFGPPWVRRTILALISFLIVMLGAATLFHGKLEYYNWWAGIIFAPFAIMIGSLGLVIAAFKPTVFEETAKKKSRFRGWPKGRSRY